MSNDRALLKKFYKIIESEKQRAQAENAGTTDVATVAERVRKLCKPFLPDLFSLLGQISFTKIISQHMKRSFQAFRTGGFRRFRKNRASFRSAPSEPEQLIFEGMEQFQGYPAQLTYEDKPGHVVFVDSRKSHESDRQKAEEYLEQLLEWDQQRIRWLKNGNRFAAILRNTYGDLSLEDLIRRWKDDHAAATN